MMQAALCVGDKIVVADSHIAAYRQLSKTEKSSQLISGFYDPETQEFKSDMIKDHFYNKEIYLVRHGTTSAPDQQDPDISEEGKQQINQITPRLCDQNFSGFCAYTSPLLRCLRTASIICKTLGLNFFVLPELIETPHFLSEYQTFKIRNRSQEFPQFDWPTSKEWHVLHETQNDFLQRVKETLNSLPSKSIVITHLGIICNMAKLALCDQKAESVATNGVAYGSVTYINRCKIENIV